LEVYPRNQRQDSGGNGATLEVKRAQKLYKTEIKKNTFPIVLGGITVFVCENPLLKYTLKTLPEINQDII
jgi:hypothetical protein